MPPIEVKGSVSRPKSLTVPSIIEEDPITLPESIPEPAPGLTPQRSQDELAAISIATQNVAGKVMAPSHVIPLTEDEAHRSAKAKAAVEARWSRRFDWHEAPLDKALEYLAELRLEVEKGGVALQNRISELRIEKVKCYACENIINLSDGKWAGMRTRNNFETGQPESAYACSQACMLTLNREYSHPVRNRE